MTTVDRVAWPLMRLGRLVQEVGGATPSKDRPEFWNGQIPWVSPKDMKRDVLDGATDHVTRDALTSTALRLVDPGAVLIVVRGMILAHTVPVAENAVPVTLNQDMKALVPRSGAHPRFLRYALKAAQPALLGLVEVAGHGTCCLRSEQWRGLEVPYPPSAVQRAIADFLDRKTAAIDTLIKKKERLLALLAEKRAALIHRAVTQGLDPTVPMKDSGIPWIGEIPAHWLVVPLRRLVRMRSGDGISVSEIEERGKYPVYGGNGVRGYCERFNQEGPGLLVGRQGALCGNVHLAHGKFWASEHALVTHRQRDDSLEWLLYVLKVCNLGQYSVSAAQPGIAVDRVLSVMCTVPPLAEQVAIAEVCATAVALTGGLQATLSSQLELLRDYRQALITSAVTGQLAIDEVAA